MNRLNDYSINLDRSKKIKTVDNSISSEVELLLNTLHFPLNISLKVDISKEYQSISCSNRDYILMIER